MGAAIFLWICFVGWLMWSSKASKETFLLYSWAAILGSGVVEALYHLFIK